ncbi:transporter substrate-binding domain-containing protein [Nocardioides currus]|uniref:ABC transporter substrate-binding protein n=1 Tax=Nocardioides currus TaxID=2133958 RepID=A0A2R7Z1B6_9ACTN|nr:transporter substrate-binding domain-containing protein [Nocardioides currus]PUA82418.1 ABC transporter substrate-binding protein [Nocardioides currus]
MRTSRTPMARIALAAVGLVALASCSSAAGSTATSEPEPSLLKDGKLTVCTSLPYEPFEYELDGEVVGFDIDLVNEVAAALDVEPVYVNEDFDAIASGELFNADKCDLGAAAMSINGDRARVVDFSSPYFNAAQVMVVQKGSGIKGLGDLAGGRVAVQEGTTGELYAADHAPPNTQIVKFKNVEDVDSALSGGTVDAGIYDNNIVGDAIKRHPTFEVVAEFDTGEQYGMAVKKDGDVDLLRVINQVLSDISESGRYDEIYTTWFGKTKAKS